jgi:hypothetical protein
MLLRILLAAAAILLTPAAAASADSIVFVKDANVWVASPDGSNPRQLTRDGTADRPYRSPSQADDGTVAASYLDSIRLIRRDGTRIRELDPPPLVDSVSHAMDGTPVDVALSPDGRTIAYTFVGASCPVGASCGARAATGYITADGQPLPGNLYLSNPSWVGSSRTLVFGGYLHQVNTHDLGAAEDVHWFDDYEIVGQPDATDLGDGELTVQGDKLALVRGYGDDTHIAWYTTNGSALPAPQCATGRLEGLYGPTWAPDGQSLAWGEPDGVWVKASALDCTVQPSLVIPGASEPDFGPAHPAGVGAAAKPKLAVRAKKRRVTLSVPCVTACIVQAKLVRRGRTIARKRTTLAGAGVAKITLKGKRGRVQARAIVTLADGSATSLQKRISLR